VFCLILETDILESENEDINYLARTNLVAGGARARGGRTYCVGAYRNTIDYTAPVCVLYGSCETAPESLCQLGKAFIVSSLCSNWIYYKHEISLLYSGRG
jgi:hypothetical protein